MEGEKGVRGYIGDPGPEGSPGNPGAIGIQVQAIRFVLIYIHSLQ